MTIKTDDNTAGDIDAEQTVSALFKLLSHHRRRIAVQYLATQAGTTSVSDVADQIALLEGEHTHDRYERICTSLIHIHLPMLADGGAIEYDSDQEVVELRDQAADMLPYLKLADT
ncbi:DUF7344 domain-containing protein [Salinibaculum salinum]|uniref:DUF7344 domain-containing protein n=1 Tax=Salinibaculum salinum TaxID=3131996 RepID=UPI0030ED84F9